MLRSDMEFEKITLGHGGGGELMQELIKTLVGIIELKRTKNGRGLDKLEDSAIIPIGDKKIAFTTDSYTVNPIFFPGGDIGKLSVCGTVNDLCMVGAEPLALSLSYVIEEGFPVSDLKRITKSINRESKKLKVPIVTGDTKVVEKGSLNKIIINTCGIGIVKKPILNDDIKEGDRIIISGSVGEHGISLLAKRFGLKTKLKSDCDSVLKIVREALKIGG